MFFKSKPCAEKLDKTLTTKLDKNLFNIFMWKKNHLSCFFARNHKVAPMAIATYWHYGKANLDETELLENTGVSDFISTSRIAPDKNNETALYYAHRILKRKIGFNYFFLFEFQI